jgi:hypothetical protein
MINGQIALSWGAAAGASNYTVFRASALAGPYTGLGLNLAGTNYTDATSVSGAANFYIVRAASPCGAVADSSIASAPLLVTSWIVGSGEAVMRGWGGTAGQGYYLLGSTNVDAPLAQWTRVATNFFGASGAFSTTNAINAGVSQEFYLIEAVGP